MLPNVIVLFSAAAATPTDMTLIVDISHWHIAVIVSDETIKKLRCICLTNIVEIVHCLCEIN